MEALKYRCFTHVRCDEDERVNPQNSSGSLNLNSLFAHRRRRWRRNSWCERSMLSETVEFNVSVLETRKRANRKTTVFPVITCLNESIEILAVGVAAGGAEKGSSV